MIIIKLLEFEKPGSELLIDRKFSVKASSEAFRNIAGFFEIPNSISKNFNSKE